LWMADRPPSEDQVSIWFAQLARDTAGELVSLGMVGTGDGTSWVPVTVELGSEPPVPQALMVSAAASSPVARSLSFMVSSAVALCSTQSLHQFYGMSSW
jgi:hypothetical protein